MLVAGTRPGAPLLWEDSPVTAPYVFCTIAARISCSSGAWLVDHRNATARHI